MISKEHLRADQLGGIAAIKFENPGPRLVTHCMDYISEKPLPPLNCRPFHCSKSARLRHTKIDFQPGVRVSTSSILGLLRQIMVAFQDKIARRFSPGTRTLLSWLQHTAAAQEIAILRTTVANEELGFVVLAPQPGCSEYFGHEAGLLDHILIEDEMQEASNGAAQMTGYCALENCDRGDMPAAMRGFRIIAPLPSQSRSGLACRPTRGGAPNFSPLSL